MNNQRKPILVAKPTEYKGVTYRSRSEARLAVCFDYAGRRFDYEPSDWIVYGNDPWIFDFCVFEKNQSDFAIEYKPAMPSGDYVNTIANRYSEMDLSWGGQFRYTLLCFDFYNQIGPNWLEFDFLEDGTQIAHVITEDFYEFFGPLFFVPGINYRFDLQ